MKWPWNGASPKEMLVVACDADSFAYVQAASDKTLPRAIRRCGVELRGEDSAQDFARRIRGLGLPSRNVVAVLPLRHSQLLQIEAPAVPPEELKAAARWRVKDMVDAHLDDLTLDVMYVGDERPRLQKYLFVAVAANSQINQITGLLGAAGMTLSAIDICETAQRNLQSSLARTQSLHERASALLMVHEGQCLLTVSANDELFYTRRLDWNEAAIASALAPAAAAEAADSFAPPLPDFESGDMPDMVDYGAEPAAAERQVETPRLVIELQRSFDVWERSWPELPLASISVEAGAHSAALAALLEHELGQRVTALDIGAVFGGLAQAAGSPEVEAACLPLLGALLRAESRKA